MVDKVLTPAQAASAYIKTAQATEKAGVGDGPSFSDFLQKGIEQSIDTMRAGEKTSAKAVTGEADIVDVIQAVTAAEQTLKTVVTLRDRLVSAYQEIMRMPM